MAYHLDPEKCREVADRGASYLARYCRQENLHYLITGSSGGLDSAVTLGIVQRACELAKEKGFELTSVALIMPCQSNPMDAALGMAAAKKFGAEIIPIDLNLTFDFLAANEIPVTDSRIKEILEKTAGREALAEWDWSRKIAQGNIKARLRMMLGTYHVAKMMKGMVMSTDNLSEYFMAFWTICGDVGDYGLIQNVLKGHELYDIARYLQVPEGIICRKPGDGLGISNCAADQIGAEYSAVEKIIVAHIQQGFNPNGGCQEIVKMMRVEGTDDAIVERILRRCLNGAYKRRGAVKLTRKQLGLPPLKEIKL